MSFQDLSDVAVFIVCMLLACWGAIARYFHKIRTGVEKEFSFLFFFCEVSVGSFCGVWAYLIATHFELSGALAAALSGAGGAAGSKVITIFEEEFADFIRWSLSLFKRGG